MDTIFIRRASNGWIVGQHSKETDEEGFPVEQVDEVFEDRGDPYEAFRDLLYAVNEAIGPPISDHEMKQIRIYVRPGDEVRRAICALEGCGKPAVDGGCLCEDHHPAGHLIKDADALTLEMRAKEDAGDA
uniref:Uncharacterized protein n=1 Tax=viral metagenome TaxID=1070528 RepID=A0A6M3K5Y1_9ZZZZ